MNPHPTPHGVLAVLWATLVLGLVVLAAVGPWWLAVGCWVVAVPVGWAAGKEAALWKNGR